MSKNRKNKLFVLIALLLIGAMALIACGGTTEAPGAETDQETTTGEETTGVQPAATEAARKVATFIFTQEFDSLNPIYSSMWFSAITQPIWNASAWNFDDQNNPHPVLVTEIPSTDNGGISTDGRVITLMLRDDIVWNDGEPITSDDFVFTYQMSIDPKNLVVSTYPYDLIESVEAPDAQTVVTTFKEPFVPWAATLWTYLLPAHVLRPVYEAEGTLDTADWNAAPTVSAGPYRFVEWESGSFARFVRNENYYNAPPNIDEIFIRFVPDDASQVAALRTGDGDLGTFIAYSDVPTLEDAGVQILSVVSGYNEGWFMNFRDTANPALQDVRVRQAIAMGFDRFKLNQDLLLGLTQPAVTFWDGTPFADPALEPWPYDPDQARKLLDDAGWVDSNGDGTRDKDGVELVLIHGTTTREIRQDTQAVAQQQLAEIGVGLDIRNYESDIYFASYGEGGPCATGELDICESSNSPSFPDPDTSYWLCSEIASDESPNGVNDQALCDPELDALFQLQKTQVDFNERQATFRQISDMMFEKIYWLGIWQDPDIWAVSGRLTNVKLSGATPFYDIANWDMQP
ncbi:MAG: peptide ABC transporter substrate-binding protein [Anaerolineales bacterium]|nr:peptide ABC transporter substrate-binding protein [Anaerolineales bacterium]MCB8952579.1 peptide ABC transporter substrate-binding protein [Ardenticatenales bacterium]